MIELFAPYRYATPLQIAILLFPLGLVLGSFSSVLGDRILRRSHWDRERSQCPHCGHTLGPLDLFPLLSFLWQRGKCHYCQLPIPWRYPMLELGCGLAGSAGGWLAGWSAGFGALGAWVMVMMVGSLLRQVRFEEQQGSSLVEVLIAVVLLVAVAIPMLDFVATVRGGAAFQRQIASTLAARRIEWLEDQVYVDTSTFWPTSQTTPIEESVGLYKFNTSWLIEDYKPNPDDVPSEREKLRQVSLTVTCINCVKPTPVKVVAIFARTK